MKVQLISDPSFDSGLGHLSRLVALGQEIRGQRGHYCFHPLNNFLNQQIEFLLMNSLEINCSCDSAPDFTIVDTYNSSYIKSLTRSKFGKVIQLVDEATPRGICDGYIEVSPISHTLNKTQYTPTLIFDNSPLFRDEIYSLKEENRVDVNAGEKGILVLGGVNDSVYIEVLSLLQSYLGGRIENFTVGTQSKSVVNFAKKAGFKNHTYSINMSNIARSFNCVISGAGVTAWELAYLKIPGFVISVVDNQEFQFSYLVKNGYRNGFSLFSKSVETDLLSCVQEMYEFPKKIPDGYGRVNTLKFLEKLAV